MIDLITWLLFLVFFSLVFSLARRIEGERK